MHLSVSFLNRLSLATLCNSVLHCLDDRWGMEAQMWVWSLTLAWLTLLWLSAFWLWWWNHRGNADCPISSVTSLFQCEATRKITSRMEGTSLYSRGSTPAQRSWRVVIVSVRFCFRGLLCHEQMCSNVLNIKLHFFSYKLFRSQYWSI